MCRLNETEKQNWLENGLFNFNGPQNQVHLKITLILSIF